MLAQQFPPEGDGDLGGPWRPLYSTLSLEKGVTEPHSGEGLAPGWVESGIRPQNKASPVCLHLRITQGNCKNPGVQAASQTHEI